MEPHSWKLGDACFIVAEDIDSRLCVMPAHVILLAGLPVPHATGMARWPDRLCGPEYEKGSAFPTKRAARAEARRQLSQKTSFLAARLVRIPLCGSAVEIEIPSNLLKIGQVIYIHDKECGEVLEVVVGFTGLEDFQFEAGYDESPGNSETGMVRINAWWSNSESALWAARREHHKEFSLVPKEVVASRANARIAKIWDDAAARLRDPEWNRRQNDGMKNFFDELKKRAPVAAG